jgi:type I restriction enzyme M protein
MFVQSEKFIEARGGRRGAAAIFGQELSHTTWRLCQMNLAIRGIEGRIEQGDTLHSDKLPDLRADFVLANPPFNMSDWGADLVQKDPRWQYGVPPNSNANFAWVQHFIHHLSPTGFAGFVLANGSMSSNQSGEGAIRKAIVEADLVDCVVALPGQLFYGTQIPVCLWFLCRDRAAAPLRDRRGTILFIHADKLGRMVDRTHRELTAEDVSRLVAAYHAWRSNDAAYADVPGFCRSASVGDVRSGGYVLTPGRYVGSERRSVDPEPVAERMRHLAVTLREQQKEAARLDGTIASHLRELGYGD